MENTGYRLYSDPFQFYHKMIKDIRGATKYVYLETFRVGADVIGERFRSALIEARKKGVEIKILIDYWGAGSVRYGFFDELIEMGGKVRFFKKIKYNFDFFTRSHRRNHRKLLLIDDEITYIGSSNITDYNMNWRESVLRMESDITHVFKKLFIQDFNIYNRYIISRAYYTRHVKHGDYEIVRDVPIITKKKINKKFIKLIQDSKDTIVIETPYFLPGFMLRKALMEAAERGVSIKVVVPKKSDVRLVDILRNKYLGTLSKRGIEFLFYEPNNLHAKLILVDNRTFGIGSSNFDYRSFRYMFEVVLFGLEPKIVKELQAHNQKTMEATIPFNYKEWEKRPPVEKFFEWLLLPFRHLL
ncbi:MAG: phosphatidylserine/phosphatidylglycerophosphate/cardiolipin synthase family protein [Bacteroidales bacterium]|nr:phosphatidylserine/phosphatidylglycerophosphate/cardiolipin synthase family protein [Bacteroidales bacterium]